MDKKEEAFLYGKLFFSLLSCLLESFWYKMASFFFPSWWYCLSFLSLLHSSSASPSFLLLQQLHLSNTLLWSKNFQILQFVRRGRRRRRRWRRWGVGALWKERMWAVHNGAWLLHLPGCCCCWRAKKEVWKERKRWPKFTHTLCLLLLLSSQSQSLHKEIVLQTLIEEDEFIFFFVRGSGRFIFGMGRRRRRCVSVSYDAFWTGWRREEERIRLALLRSHTLHSNITSHTHTRTDDQKRDEF